MLKASLVLVFFISIGTLLATHVSSKLSSVPTFVVKLCRNTEFGTYTTNNTYEKNLETVLTTLSTQSSSERFLNASVGDGTDTVHVQYYCRGDVSSALCNTCVLEATIHALNCSNAKAGIVWYEQCTLCYMNESMFGINEELLSESHLTLNLTDPAAFSPVLNDTVSNLIQVAAFVNGSSPGTKFGTAQRTMSDLTAFFLVQCSPDLNDTQCESCLLNAFKATHTCCGEWPKRLYIFSLSCQVMYDTTGIFYFDPNTPPPSPTLPTQSPPPSVGTKSPSPAPINGGLAMIRGSESMKVRIMTIALVFIGLVFNT